MKKAFSAAAYLLILTAGYLAFAQTPPAPAPRPRPRPSTAAATRDIPKEGSLYVWQTPEEGFQTLLVLRVTGADTLEAAYLVPVRVKLHGASAPSDAAAAKKSSEALDKIVGGRLINAALKGRDPSGQILADVHLGAGSKDDPNQPAGWLTDLLIKQKLLVPAK